MGDVERKFPQDYLVYDKEHLLSDIESLPLQIKEGFALGKGVKLPKQTFRNIIICGMGGSAFPGFLLRAYLPHLPIHVHNDYDASPYLTDQSLVIASSYSGNTEETLSAYKAARRKGATIISIASGGKLQKLAESDHYPFIQLPKGKQPRAGYGYFFFALLALLIQNSLAKDHDKEIKVLLAELDMRALKERAIILSGEIKGRLPLIYTDHAFKTIGMRWRTQFNENAKIIAHSAILSECNHNEIEAYVHNTADFIALFLSHAGEHRRIKKRIEITQKVIRKRDIPVVEIATQGSTQLTKMFRLIALGDLTSFYLALRFEQDPSLVPAVEQLKKDLGPFIV
ncbi:MAG: bifunctional phosphoglucose/phosphomannose isomerase [Candidatus Woesearchaeota archaeon]|nr:MAG: bifunctional phosphoglucose/phosphomannose isomerase [Candidatus Woesearchaeota archaeon]